jgi:hypothetical protein
MSICKASEILRNEAYIEVRRNASGPEGLRPGGTGDEGNAADGRFPTASTEIMHQCGAIDHSKASSVHRHRRLEVPNHLCAEDR